MALIYFPNFFKNFVCKCASCRRSCCGSDWAIGLTREEYERCLTHPDPELRGMAEKGLHPLNESTDDLYAACTTDESGRCRLLSSEGLCSWQLANGHCVGAICDEFPRFHLKYMVNAYVFPTLGCEAVVEALWDTNEIISLSADENEDDVRYNIVLDDDVLEKRPLFGYYADIIGMGIRLLQNRRYSLDERMLLMTNAANLLNYLELKGRTELIPQAVASFGDERNLHALVEKYSTCSVSPSALLTVNWCAMTRQLELPQFRAQAMDTLRGMGFAVESIEGDYRVSLQDKEAYTGRKRALRPYVEEHNMFFENLLVCEFLRSMTFFTEPDIFSSFCVFNCWYALLKGTVYGLFEQAPDERELIDAIVEFQRMIVHQSDEYNDLLSFVRNVKMKDPDSMAALALG